MFYHGWLNNDIALFNLPVLSVTTLIANVHCFRRPSPRSYVLFLTKGRSQFVFHFNFRPFHHPGSMERDSTGIMIIIKLQAGHWLCHHSSVLLSSYTAMTSLLLSSCPAMTSVLLAPKSLCFLYPTTGT